MNSTTLDDFPSICDLVYSTLGILISFTTNGCGYTGLERDFIIEWLGTMFLKAEYADSKKDNLNWWESMSVTFYD